MRSMHHGAFNNHRKFGVYSSTHLWVTQELTVGQKRYTVNWNMSVRSISV